MPETMDGQILRVPVNSNEKLSRPHHNVNRRRNAEIHSSKAVTIIHFASTNSRRDNK